MLCLLRRGASKWPLPCTLPLILWFIFSQLKLKIAKFAKIVRRGKNRPTVRWWHSSVFSAVVECFILFCRKDLNWITSFHLHFRQMTPSVSHSKMYTYACTCMPKFLMIFNMVEVQEMHDLFYCTTQLCTKHDYTWPDTTFQTKSFQCLSYHNLVGFFNGTFILRILVS